jgi:ABC-type polysaccharide/polyol phosphate export permease
MMNGQQFLGFAFVIAIFVGTIYGLVTAFQKSHYQDYQEGFETSKDLIFPLVGIGAAVAIGGGYALYTFYKK